MKMLDAIKRSVRIFPLKDRRRIVAITFVQIFLGILDLLGVATVGVLGALAVNGIQSRHAGNRVQSVLNLLGLGSLSFQEQVALLGLLAAVTLIIRTLTSIFLTRRILQYLSRKSALISSELVSRLFAQDLLEIQTKTSQEVLYAILAGVNTISIGIVGTLVTLTTDLSLFLLMIGGLVAIDPLMAILTFIIFGFTALILYKLMHKRAQEIGEQAAEISVRSNEMILEVMNSYREAIVRNRRPYYVEQIQNDRIRMAQNSAEISFFPYISKYVFESVVILGGLGIAALQFMTQDATHAIAVLAVFMAAGSRIAPAVLRLQQSAIQIKSSIGAAGPTLDLIERLDRYFPEVTESHDCAFNYPEFNPEIVVKDLSFKYPTKSENAISKANIDVPPGTSIAFVGPSGSGKTTLVDLILGLLKPMEGHVKISGLPPSEVTSKWPGSISYVPQDVMIINGSIKENITLGFPGDTDKDDEIERALKIAQLWDFVNTLPDGLNTTVGERGTRLSGGQRQRLGIARALFTKPKLLVLDEATSALDGMTEKGISDAINQLQGDVTVLLIAHRLSTIKNVNQVVYIDGGKIVAKGSFEEIRKVVPDFDAQAKLMS